MPVLLMAGNPNVMVCERGTMFGYSDLIVDPRNFVLMRDAGCPVTADITHALQQPTGKPLEVRESPPLCNPLELVALDVNDNSDMQFGPHAIALLSRGAVWPVGGCESSFQLLPAQQLLWA